LLAAHHCRVGDIRSLLKTFELVDSWIKYLRESKKAISTFFDYNFFFNGVKIALYQEIGYLSGRVLLLLFETFDLYPGKPLLTCHHCRAVSVHGHQVLLEQTTILQVSVIARSRVGTL